MKRRCPLPTLGTCLCLILLLAGLTTGPAALAESVGTTFTYQGQLKEFGSPVTIPSATLRFALFDAATDGNQIGSSASASPVSVVNGLFTAPVDASQFGTNAFNGEARWLEIAVYRNDAWVTLSPRQKLTPTPYASFALNAAGLVLPFSGTSAVDTVNGFQINHTASECSGIRVESTGSETGAITAIATGTDSIAVEARVAGGAMYAVIGEANTLGRVTNYGGKFSALGDSGRGVYGLASSSTGTNYGVYGQTNSTSGYGGYFVGRGHFSGNLGIGTTSPSQKLDVAGTAKMTGFQLTTSPTAGYVLTSDASGVGTWQPAGTGSGPWQMNGTMIYYSLGNVGIRVTDPESSLHLLGGYGDLSAGEGDFKIGNSSYRLKMGVSLAGVDAGNCRMRAAGTGAKLMLGTNTTDALTINGSFVGINTTAPAAALDVAGRVKADEFRLGTSATAGYVLTTDANGVGTWQAPTGGGGLTLPYEGTLSSGSAGIHVTNNSSGAGLFGEGGNYGVRGESATVGVNGFSGAGTGVNGYSNTGVGVKAQSGGTGVTHPALYVSNNNSNGIGIYSLTGSTDANVVVANTGTGDLIKGFSGSTAGDLVFKVANNGTTVTRVLQITGGADLAEKFDVGGEARAGMVVMIDPDQPGKLCVARGSYNRCVAGVISGAKGVEAGMILADLSGAANSMPVALTGRVWVFCEAPEKAVEPGDMLTTAERPGYAMPVVDHDRANGAVLGKAMSRLAKGESGMVLALVNLQ